MDEEFKQFKDKVIALITEKPYTLNQLSSITGQDRVRCNTIIQNLKRVHQMEVTKIDGNRECTYKLLGFLVKEELPNPICEKFEHTPIEDMPADISRSTLCTWGISNPVKGIHSTRMLIAYAKNHGKRIYERDSDSGRIRFY